MDLEVKPGRVTDLVVEARAVGRAAVPSTFHTRALASLIGWSGGGLAAVVLEVVDGVADFVAHAAEADVFLVVVAGGVAEVDPHDVTIEPQPSIGDEEWCRVGFRSVPTVATMPADVDAALARAAIVRAADAVGAAEAAMEAAVARVKERHQWGAPLGVLQAVQHRCAQMLIDVTLASDAVYDAAGIADRGAPEAEVRLAASYAKATAGERARRVTASAHQLAGGEGIYADAPFHRWYRRAKVAELVLGDNRTHRATVAASLLD